MPGSSAFPAEGTPIYSSGVTPYEVTGTPYTDSQINELQFSQSADVLYITHPSHPFATLSRYSDTDWRYEVPTIDYGPYLDQKVGDQDTSLTLSGVTDRVVLTSTAADFSASVPGDFIQYSFSGQKVLGLVKAKFTNYVVSVEPLEDRSLVFSKEVYSPGLYTGWDVTNSVPTYDATITGTSVTVAFSAVGVVTQEHIGNYLRFTDKAGAYYWMTVTGVGDIPRQGAYGILATGDILDVTVPTGTITRSLRRIAARLTSSDPAFFNLTYDIGRLFRLVLGEYVVHARVRSAATYTLPGITNNGDGFIAMTYEDAAAVTAGDSVTGPGIPGGTTVVASYPNDASYVTLSANVTTSEPAGSFVFTASSGQDMGVLLNRSIPRSIEGLTAIQNGTSNDWNKGAWFVGNYPATVTFHEGRLGFGGTTAQPQTVWLSKVDDLYNFGATDEKLRVLDDSAITFTIASDTVNMIQWLMSRQVLVIGTVGSEWKAASTSQGAPMTPTTVSVQAQSTYGCEFVKPITIGKSLLYLQRAGRKLRQMSYDYQSDTQVSLDLTVFAEHVLKDHGGAVQICYQQLPESIVYARLNDGTVGCLTYEADQQVYSWSRFILGGPDAWVESIACVPEGSQYRLYLAVSRTINGATVRSIEVLEPEFRPTSSTDKTTMLFLDNYASGGAHAAALTGLNDFKGCTVNAVVDNAVYHDLTVAADGTLTLPAAAATRYAVGFPFTSTLKTFPIEAPAQMGTTQGKVKRMNHLSLRLLDSYGFSHGGSLSRLTYETFNGTAMFSGDKRVPFENGFDTRGAFYVVQSKSYPLAILSLMPEIAQYS